MRTMTWSEAVTHESSTVNGSVVSAAVWAKLRWENVAGQGGAGGVPERAGGGWGGVAGTSAAGGGGGGAAAAVRRHPVGAGMPGVLRAEQ